jgi:hypothetical protein
MRSRRLERYADASALLPDNPAGFLDAAVVEDEPRRNGLGAMHIDAGAAGTEIHDITSGRRLFQIDKYRSCRGGWSAGPNAMEPSLVQHFGRSQKVLLVADYHSRGRRTKTFAGHVGDSSMYDKSTVYLDDGLW